MFLKHSAEIQITPSADYFFFIPGKMNIGSPYRNKFPYIGIGAGLQYIFRPIHLFGISSGIQFRMHGEYYKGRPEIDYGSTGGEDFWESHNGYISVPLYIHLYKKMNRCNFEFATGLDFNFNFFTRSSYDIAPNLFQPGEKGRSFQWMKNDFIQRYASLGWSVFLGGELRINKHADVFLGPHFQFLNIFFFNNKVQQQKVNFRYYDVGLGFKAGFRIH